MTEVVLITVIFVLAVLVLLLFVQNARLQSELVKMATKRLFLQAQPPPPVEKFQRGTRSSKGELDEGRKVSMRADVRSGSRYGKRGNLSYTTRNGLIHWSDGHTERIDGKPMPEHLAPDMSFPRPVEPVRKEQRDG